MEEAAELQPIETPKGKITKKRKKSSASTANPSQFTNGDAPKVEAQPQEVGAPLPERVSPPDDTTIPIPSDIGSDTPAKKVKKYHWTARFPGQLLPTVVGPVGMGLCWKKLSTVWDNNKALEIVSLVILGWTVFQMTVLFLLMAYRSIRYPKISLLEHKHPTHYIFGILITLYFCLISSFILHWNLNVARVFWYIGFGSMCIYMVYACHRLIAVKTPVAHTNAFYLFGPLPILLAIQLAPYAPSELLLFGWSVGTVWYFGLHVLLVFRWMHIGLPAKRDRASIWLLIAASADSVLGYVAAAGFGEPAKVIFFFSLLQFATILSLSKKIFASGFVATWWMTTLPSTAFSSQWISYGVALNNRGIIIFGTVLVGIATVWILSLYVMTIVWMFRKNLLPKTPYRPPVEKLPLE